MLCASHRDIASNLNKPQRQSFTGYVSHLLFVVPDSPGIPRPYKHRTTRTDVHTSMRAHSHPQMQRQHLAMSGNCCCNCNKAKGLLLAIHCSSERQAFSQGQLNTFLNLVGEKEGQLEGGGGNV